MGENMFDKLKERIKAKIENFLPKMLFEGQNHKDITI